MSDPGRISHPPEARKVPSDAAATEPHGDDIDRRLARLAGQPFRARFRLGGRDLDTALRHSPFVLRQHALDLVTARVAPAAPAKDGRQTPYRGHPVFVAQHATATCCRTCLHRWHGIPKGRAMTDDEVVYAVEVISRWIGQEVTRAGEPGDQQARLRLAPARPHDEHR
jgi:hypothetical protein